MKRYILFLAVSCFLSSLARAEYNLATEKEEFLLYSTAREVGLGRSLAASIEKRFKICKDAEMQERLDKIGEKLALVCDRQDISYSFTVLQEDEVNAFALPGGYVYVNRALLEKTESDDEVAAAVAHEIGHIVARHSIKRLQAALGYNLLSILTAATTRDPRFTNGVNLAFNQVMLGYSREDEFLADKLSVKYMEKAGYNPQAVIRLLNRLRQIEKEKPLKPLVSSMVRTHPYLPERIAAARQEIYGKMDFQDYINKER